MISDTRCMFIDFTVSESLGCFVTCERVWYSYAPLFFLYLRYIVGTTTQYIKLSEITTLQPKIEMLRFCVSVPATL